MSDKLKFNNLPNPNWGKQEHFIKYEGFYVFGGRMQDGELSYDLHILMFGDMNHK